MIVSPATQSARRAYTSITEIIPQTPILICTKLMARGEFFMKPHILLSGGAGKSGSGIPLLGVPETYARAIVRAGGLPSLALCDGGADYARRYDGLLLTGGADVDPALFGEAVYNETVEIDAARDFRERQLFDAFCAAGKPVLGICRGIQMLVVFLGGTLWQDLPAQRGLVHAAPVRAHPVRLQRGHPLAALLGESLRVNTFHHQAIKTLPAALTAVGWSDDGLVEAVSHVRAPVWGVQWHPERMTGADDLPDQHKIFERFVQQCKTD